MGRISITEENRTGQGGDRFAQMKLITNERARFFVYDEPWAEWIHELKAPKIEGGVAVMEQRTKKDKTTFEVVAQEFLRRSICLGRPDVMKQNGLDEEFCPACKASLESGGDVPRPVQRFAVPVVRYKLASNGRTVQNPFSAEVLIWSVTARMWDSIVELAVKLGDLRKHDLTLECEDGGWQRNKLSFEMDAAYLAGAENLNYVKALLGDVANRPTEDQLRDACGSVATRSYMEQDVNLILARWRQVHNAGSGGALPAVTQTQTAPVDLGAGIDALLGNELAGTPFAPGAPQSAQPVQVAYDAFQAGATPQQAVAAAQAAATGADPLGDLFSAAPGTPATSPVQPSAVPAAAAAQPSPSPVAQTVPAAAAPAASSGDLDFETLLGL